jgi:UPF0755 protein
VKNEAIESVDAQDKQFISTFARPMKRRFALILLLVVSTILLSTFSFYVYQVLYSPNFLIGEEKRYLNIPTGSTFSDVQDLLADEDLVNDLIAFSFLARLMNYDESVKPGHYPIAANAANLEVIRMLRAGLQEPVDITYSVARTMEEMANSLCANIELDAQQWLAHLEQPETWQKYGFDEETFRCMFIPNTYEVYWTTGPEALTERLHKEYEKFWTADRKEQAAAIGLSPVEVSILASIVQAESRHADESPVIAGLYINRLQKGMPLQADPTLVFAAGDFTIQRVLNVHKEIDSPYNTYKYAGLPPGPINFPSVTSLKAVLNYQENNYLYMCAKPDFSGYHNFSHSLRQHMINAREYQRALNQAKLYK